MVRHGAGKVWARRDEARWHRTGQDRVESVDGVEVIGLRPDPLERSPLHRNDGHPSPRTDEKSKPTHRD